MLSGIKNVESVDESSNYGLICLAAQLALEVCLFVVVFFKATVDGYQLIDMLLFTKNIFIINVISVLWKHLLSSNFATIIKIILNHQYLQLVGLSIQHIK